MKKKLGSRKTLQQGGVMTVIQARHIIEVKETKEGEKRKKRAIRQAVIEANTAKKALYRAGVDARKAERERKKTITALRKGGKPIPWELSQPIKDPEKEAQLMSIVERI